MASGSQRVVLDSNVVVSRLLAPNSVPARAVHKASYLGQVLVSDDFLKELTSVLGRRKFDRYLSFEDRSDFLSQLRKLAQHIVTRTTIVACRDPKDNIILELAFDGQPDIIVTGDGDLLSLGTFHGIPIITPAVYIAS